MKWQDSTKYYNVQWQKKNISMYWIQCYQSKNRKRQRNPQRRIPRNPGEAQLGITKHGRDQDITCNYKSITKLKKTPKNTKSDKMWDCLVLKICCIKFCWKVIRFQAGHVMMVRETQHKPIQLFWSTVHAPINIQLKLYW